jgi:hypothetical protein
MLGEEGAKIVLVAPSTLHETAASPDHPMTPPHFDALPPSSHIEASPHGSRDMR